MRTVDEINRRNMFREAIWCIVIAFWGVGIAFAAWQNRYVQQYYYETEYAVAVLILTFCTLAWVALCWFWSSSDSGKAQSMRLWISENGTLAPVLSFIPVWIFASLTHFVCTSLCIERDSGYVIFSVFTMPFVYMALTYALPPIEIKETILPGGPVVQRITRFILFVGLAAVAIGIAFYDLG